MAREAFGARRRRIGMTASVALAAVRGGCVEHRTEITAATPAIAVSNAAQTTVSLALTDDTGRACAQLQLPPTESATIRLCGIGDTLTIGTPTEKHSYAVQAGGSYRAMGNASSWFLEAVPVPPVTGVVLPRPG